MDELVGSALQEPADGRGLGRRVGVIAAVIAMFAFVVHGGGFLEPAAPKARSRPAVPDVRARAERAGIDVDGVIDKVRHRVTPAADGSPVLEAQDPDYRARFDAAGFHLSLADDVDFGLALTGVRRGGPALAGTPGAWRADANVARRDVGVGIIEQVTARAGEVEWDVVLASPPAGAGDLRVEAELRGLHAAAQREAGGNAPGWRFELAGGQAVRMDEAVVKDARGVELHRALPSVDGTRLSLLVPASVLASAAYPLTIDPTVSAGHPVSDPVYGPASGHQFFTSVASDGTNFLVVWSDSRSEHDPDVFGDIYGARVSPAGVVLDPSGIAIARVPGGQADPAVAFDGTNFLVVWTDDFWVGDADVVGARVSRAGSVLDGVGIRIGTGSRPQREPAVAFDGTNFFVVWSADGDVFGTRVSRAGSVLDAPGIPLSTAPNGQGSPAVAFDGTNLLVVWSDGRLDSFEFDIFGARVRTSSFGGGRPVVLDPDGIPIATAPKAQRSPAVAFDGTNFLVVWGDSRTGERSDIFGTRVTRAGSVLDAAGIAIATSGSEPAVAFDGNNFLVAWAGNGATGARVTRAGSVLDPTGIFIGANEGGFGGSGLAVAFNGTDYLVVWTQPQAGFLSYFDVAGARVMRSGSVLDPTGIAVATSANDQTMPAVAFDGTNFLVVWADGQSGDLGSDIFGARVTPSGSLLDGTGIPIATRPGSQSHPAVAFDGTNYLVVWSDGDIFGARVTTSGSVLDTTSLPIATATELEFVPAVAFNGADYLVVWERYSASSSFDILATRVTPAGSLLDATAIPIATDPGSQTNPAVASDGTNFLVVWAHDDIVGARVSPAGSVLDLTDIPISTAPNQQHTPTVSFDGTNFLVVWWDKRSGDDVFGGRVTPSGSVLDGTGIPIATGPSQQLFPSVAFSGSSSLVVWREESSSGTEIVGTRVSPDGTVSDRVRIVPSPNGGRFLPSPYGGGGGIAGAPGGRFGVVYDRFVPGPPYGAYRVFLRTVSPK